MKSEMRRWRGERGLLIAAAVGDLLWRTAAPAQAQWQLAVLVLLLAWGLTLILLGPPATKALEKSMPVDAVPSEVHRLLELDVIALNDAVATEIMGWHLTEPSGRRIWCAARGKPVQMMVYGKLATICRVPFVARVNNPTDWAFQPATDFHALGIDWRAVVTARLRELGIDDDFKGVRSGHEFCRAAIQANRLRRGQP
ncbi:MULTISPECIES: hypothetical protein [unclassified Dyella]|uniref:hypothetical protein n=1 Tax=Dyella sp. ASV21 TaxID=2795114 RepID=UPI0018EDC2E6|nr:MULTISPECIES: hypothetical protein [unclassified Dyella]